MKSLNCLFARLSGPKVSRPQRLAASSRAGQVVDRVHRARIVDVVARHQRRIERTGPRRMQELEEEGRLIRIPGEDAIDPEILRADNRAQILPLRRFGVRRRLLGVRTDVTEPAGNSDAVGAHQLLRQVVVGIVVEPLGIPFFCRGLVEVGIGEEPQSDDPGRVPVIRTSRDVSAARADRDTGIFLRIFERIGRAIGVAHVEPQTVALRVRSGGLRKTGLVDQAEIIPPVVAAVFQPGV